MRKFGAAAIALLALAAAWPGAARGATFQVPSGACPTVQRAVTLAANSPDPDNVIEIVQSPVIVDTTIFFDRRFGPLRHVTLRPASWLPRATLLSRTLNMPAMTFFQCMEVTVQDLDLLRDITNTADLVSLNEAESVLVQRCRFGTNVASMNPGFFSMFVLNYPIQVVIRNCVFTAALPGTFETGIKLLGYGDVTNSLFLYNNDVADYRTNGIYLHVHFPPGGLLVLRNNIVMNNPGLNPEPTAYRSDVDPGPTLLTSHNTGFAGAGFHQALDAGTSRDIAGLVATGHYLGGTRGDIAVAFVASTWMTGLPYDANPDLFRCVPTGMLHGVPSAYGINVGPGPTTMDLSVPDDLERLPRPSGSPLHTDRGARQLETVAAAPALAQGPAAPAPLRVTATRDGARGAALRYHAEADGRLRVTLVDAAGRLRAEMARGVAAGDSGLLPVGDAARAPGVYFFRATLSPPAGEATTVTGKVIVGR